MINVFVNFLLKSWVYPWKRTFDYQTKSPWETDPQFCEKVKAMDEFRHGTILMEMIDMSIFDFLIGNLNRAHFETFRWHEL